MQLEGLAERYKLPQWGLRRTRFGAYWVQKVQLCWQQFLLIFLRTNAIFCTRTSLISTPYEEFFSWCILATVDLTMVVGACDSLFIVKADNKRVCTITREHWK